MNKPLAIAGVTAGALCAFYLTVGLPSFGDVLSFGSCTQNSGKAFVSRELPWSGGDSVEIRVPATVHFKVGPEWHATANGPAEVLKHLRFADGRIEFDRSRVALCDARLTIDLTGPAVRQWIVSASGDLTLEQLNQTELNLLLSGSGSIAATGVLTRTYATLSGSGKLRIDGGAQQDIAVEISGSGMLTASGATERMQVSIPGSGSANLGALPAKTAMVSIDGSGRVALRAEDSAEVRINGSGIVRLLQKPTSVQTQINGSGRIVGAT